LDVASGGLLLSRATTNRNRLQKFGKFRPKFHGEAKSLGHAFELIANENTVLLLLASARHLSPAGGREDITTSWLRD